MINNKKKAAADEEEEESEAKAFYQIKGTHIKNNEMLSWDLLKGWLQ